MNDSQNKTSNDKNTRVIYSYDEAVELTGHGRYNYMVLVACSIISNASGIDMFGFSVVLPAATCDLQLGMRVTGVLASAPFAGILLAFPWGYYADTRGRKRALLLSTSVGFILAALCSFAPSWQVMLPLKFLGSCLYAIVRYLVQEEKRPSPSDIQAFLKAFSSSAAYTLTMTYLGESTGSRVRSRYLFIMNSANVSAEAIFYSIAYFILPLTFKLSIPWLGITFRSWRLYNLILAAPLGIGALMLLLLEESPKFLANKGENEKALKVLKNIYKVNGGNDEYPVKKFTAQIVQQDTPAPSFWSSIAKQTVPLFKPPLLWRTIQLFYLIALCCSVNNIFIMWYPMMVNLFFNSFSNTDSLTVDSSFCQRVVSNITVDTEADNYICNDTITPNTIYSGIILGVVFAVLNLTAATVASWRRLVLLTVYTVSAVCLVLVNLVRDPIANMIVFTLIQVTAIGIGCVASYFVDLYPTSYSGLVTSLGVMVSRLASFGGVNLIGVVIVSHCTMTFNICAIVVCSGIMMALLLPSDRKFDTKVQSN